MNSREFVHRWAQGDVDWAHGNGKGRRSGNLSVAADTETRAVRLYSYAEHIASVILTPGTEERRKVILIESRPGRSSNTTSEHLRMAFDAAPSICFRVPHVEPSSREQHINNAQYLLSVARELYRRSGRARAMKTQLVLDAQNSYNDSIKYAELFGVQDMFNISREPLDVPEKLNSALEAAWGAVEAERKERARKEREAAREDLERWINNGTTYPPPSCQTDETGSVYLRLTPDGMVETSRSARVPLHSALRLYKLCIKTKEAGKSLDAHNRPLRVGFYTLTSIAANGDAIVGCHRISFDRMTDLFEKLPESVRIANVSPMGEDGPDDVAANTL